MMKFINYKNILWIDIQNPQKKDIDYLKQNFKFDNFILDELIPPSQRVRVEKYKDYLFLVMHFPEYNERLKTTRIVELDILVTKNVIITVHTKLILPLKILFDKCNLYKEKKEQYLSDKNTGKLLYFIIDKIFMSCFSKLENISFSIENIEKEMFKGKERQLIAKILLLKKDILDFRRSLKPQKTILESLNQLAIIFFNSEIKPYYHDLMGDYLRIWGLLETHQETVNALGEANEAIFSYKLNERMKFLTIFATLLLPISLISSIFGMNILMPHFIRQNPNSFLFILSGMAFVTILLFLWFKRLKWF